MSDDTQTVADDRMDAASILNLLAAVDIQEEAARRELEDAWKTNFSPL